MPIAEHSSILLDNTPGGVNASDPYYLMINGEHYQER